MRAPEITREWINGKDCFIFENRDADVILFQGVDAHDSRGLDDEVAEIHRRAKGAHFSLYAFLAGDWNRELSPWQAPAVFGDEAFGGDAGETLTYLTGLLLPEVRARHRAGAKLRYILGGYSLSGLFALWTAYQTDTFDGIAAASPSVWFPGWESYIAENEIRSRVVYLSLGDKEEKTKNPIMARVGRSIRQTADKLRMSEGCARSILEWNPGNHFRDVAIRQAKAFAWVMETTAAAGQ